jgi:hypothetical protein
MPDIVAPALSPGLPIDREGGDRVRAAIAGLVGALRASAISPNDIVVKLDAHAWWELLTKMPDHIRASVMDGTAPSGCMMIDGVIFDRIRRDEKGVIKEYA